MTVGRLTGQNEGLSFLTEIPLGRLTSYAKPRQFPKGSQISDGSEFADAAWFLLSGSCELRHVLESGTEEVITSFVPGEVFGTTVANVSKPGSNVDEDQSAAQTRVFEDATASDASAAETFSVVATSDSVVLCFDRTTLRLLRLELEQQKEPALSDSDGAARERAVAGALLSLRTAKTEPSSKLITLSFISDSLPSRFITNQFARYLQSETDEDVVLVRFDSSATPQKENGRAFWPRRTADGYFELTLSRADENVAPGLLGTRGELRRFPYIIVEADGEGDAAPWLREILVRSDLAYLFVQSGSQGLYHLEQLVREVRARGRNQAAQLKPIACLHDGEPIDGFDLIAQNLGVPVHLYVRGCPTVENGSDPKTRPIFGADIRRLARGASGRMLGLALSSGAAKGFAHIGVIQVLEENGIEVDVVAGASMGAYVGSIWAYGHEGTELERLAREVEGKWKLWSLVDPIFPPRQGFLRGYAIKRRLERSLGKAQFADLMRPMRVVATNLNTLERKVFSAGQVSAAVHASVAVPGICVPVTLDGETYIDGGVMDPLPVEVLREMGITRVIAVDAIPTPDTMRNAAEAETAKEERARSIFRKAISIDKQLNYFARGNLFEILMRSVHGAQIRAAEASCRQADLVLRPDILDDRWLDFRHPGKFIALGREVALRHLDGLKSLANGEAAAEPRLNESNGLNKLNAANKLAVAK